MFSIMNQRQERIGIDQIGLRTKFKQLECLVRNATLDLVFVNN